MNENTSDTAPAAISNEPPRAMSSVHVPLIEPCGVIVPLSVVVFHWYSAPSSSASSVSVILLPTIVPVNVSVHVGFEA